MGGDHSGAGAGAWCRCGCHKGRTGAWPQPAAPSFRRRNVAFEHDFFVVSLSVHVVVDVSCFFVVVLFCFLPATFIVCGCAYYIWAFMFYLYHFDFIDFRFCLLRLPFFG